MDNRGQSALEYLMTYGWALIVIAIVIGVLIFVTGGATGGVTCQSQSTGMILQEWSVTTGSVGITLQNATGGTIGRTTNINAEGREQFAGLGFDTIPNDNNIAPGSTFTVQNLNGGPQAGNLSNAIIVVNYETQGGLPASATIVCNGTVN